MTIAACPRCHDEISLPSRGRPESRVKCPLCLEEMRYEEVLASVPPTLILLDAEDHQPEYAPITAAAQTEWASTSMEEPAGEYAMAGAASGTDEFLGGGVGAATSTFGSPGASISTGPVVPRRQPSVVMEGLKVMVGGVVGIGLAVIVLWWLPKDYAKDILQIGPSVANYAPWIVPPQFHGKGKSNGPSANAGMNENANPTKNNQPKNTVKIENAPPKGDFSFNNLPNIPGKEPPAETPAEDPLANNEPLAPSEPDPNDPLAVVDPLAMPEEGPGDEVATNDPTATSLPGVEPEPTPEPTEPGPVPEPMPEPPPFEPEPTEPAAPSADPAKLADSITAAQAALTAFENPPDPKDVANRRKLGTELFAAASRIGEEATKLDARDSAAAPVFETIPELLKSLTNTAGKVSMLGFLANQKLDSPGEEKGIVCVGTVKAIRAAGKVFEVEVTSAAADKRPLVIVTRENPQDVTAVDQKIVVLGALVDNPTDIKGYQGEAALVILSGHLLPLE